MAPQSELTALAQEIMEMDSETFEIADYLDAENSALGIYISGCSSSTSSSCSSSSSTA